MHSATSGLEIATTLEGRMTASEQETRRRIEKSCSRQEVITGREKNGKQDGKRKGTRKEEGENEGGKHVYPDGDTLGPDL